MRKILFIVSILFNGFGFSQTNITSYNVLYGERNLNNDTFSIFIDKNGYFYPHYPISDSILKVSNNNLLEWYFANEEDFIKIGLLYNCKFEAVNKQNCFVLNDSIKNSIIRQLNTTILNSTTFLIHGFRKTFKDVEGDRSSSSDFNLLINSHQQSNVSKTKYVSVYWDAYYDCCFSSNISKNNELFQLFELAQLNAVKVGESLKTILTAIKSDTLNIITHSLGAKVALYSLFDIQNNQNSTPCQQNIRCYLIAPAISGELLSENFEKRINCNNDSVDNYEFNIIYNKKDFVLRKKDNILLLFGPGPFKFGNTSLGCDAKHAIQKLKTYFSEEHPNTKVNFYDLTKSVGKCHHVSCYCERDNLKLIFK